MKEGKTGMKETSVTLRIKVEPPFDFDLTAKSFSDEVALCMRDEQICKYSDGKFWRILRANDKLIFVVVKSIGDINNPELEVQLTSSQKISEGDKEIIKKQVSSIFDLDSDLKSFYEAVQHDEFMSKMIDQLYGLKRARSPNMFEALVYIILEQQISLQAAYSIEKRLIQKFGDRMQIDQKIYYAFPTPEKLAFLEIEDLRPCGTSQRKSEYIRDIAKKIVEGQLDLELLQQKDEEQMMEELCKLRGVGPWTAELAIIRGAGKLRAIPAADLGLREHIARYYFKDEGRKRVSSEEVRQVAEGWGQWRGIAGYYAVVAGRLELEI